ncbi:hypothetical protein BaRGS_00018157 [Batillaria attramentaria]|uniref:Uncharacterized protein n=1 Tax=Batillaria attramentaria TaxID=370345 RepID=A0ABD0KUI2_9CAEN
MGCKLASELVKCTVCGDAECGASVKQFAESVVTGSAARNGSRVALRWLISLFGMQGSSSPLEQQDRNQYSAYVYDVLDLVCHLSSKSLHGYFDFQDGCFAGGETAADLAGTASVSEHDDVILYQFPEGGFDCSRGCPRSASFPLQPWA